MFILVVSSALSPMVLSTTFTNNITGIIYFMFILRSTYPASIFERDVSVYNFLIQNTSQSDTVKTHLVRLPVKFGS